ncbi:tRNA (guanosine(46)-N7)-methyltransferase TrmB [Metamycoplasma phocicerebrale]|uniref:tRNA (guanine-N(7)-)-methyltransferase n=1 Tax=Metamycoplasma phocicerebrale TaxID=142649 RepID=A0A3T0TUQ2_9BACT|nr:tRNA (guanosine(46)-N7)-methyltransferase TrmB [Metamycoplasma phocicerebrale]AZZ65689.1 tRNA (guanosine(46)-N7)-methyltransferase TrmB [Metamycoplasma phocicerebrale]
MRLRHNKNAINILEKSPFFIQNFPFEINDNYIIEIGMGKGKMLSELAENNPQKHYIGIEKYSTPALSALKKIENKKIDNMQIIVADANDLDKIFIGKIKTIWLTFSDPWPKKRHFKRRLVYRDFLKKYQSILAKDGIVYFKSDNEGLYNFALEELKEYKAKILYQTKDLYDTNYPVKNYLTDYEEKFKKEGKNIYFIAFSF